MCAASIATSVPAPIAMPTSARASAGASLTPSPTIATRRPASWSPRTFASLSSGSTSAKTSSMPTSRADRVGDLPRVAGDHRHPQSAVVQRARPPRVTRGAARPRAPVRPAPRLPRTTCRTDAPRRLNSLGALARAPRAARHRARAGAPARRRRRRRRPRVASHAAPGHRPEAARGRHSTPRSLARRGDRARDRMLGLLLDGAGQAEQPVVVAVAAPRIAGDRVRAARERAGLVEQHGVDLAHALQAEPVAHEDALARRQRRGERDDERDGQPERVRARDHEHRHRARDGVVGVADDERARPGT